MSVSLGPSNRLATVAGERFDVVVIGGGIIGAGIARDAAMRGLSVALFEKADFGGGTTAGSTRLIHGGLRYLEMLDFGLVRMDLRERETLLRIAPHLVKPLEFVMPFYGSSILYRCKIKLGMTLYDLLSYDKSLPRHRFLTSAELKQIEPNLCQEDLQGAMVYFDAQANSPERLCLENIIAAREHGAQTFNYMEVTGADRAGDMIQGIRVCDLLGGDPTEVSIKTRLVVNASGAWFDRVAGRLSEPGATQIRTTKGVHISCPPVTKRAVVVFSRVDGRLMFVIPWLGHSWIGTTETEFADDPATAMATSADVDYVLRSVTGYFPPLGATQIHFSNAGVRALVKEKGSSSSISRKHRIVREAPSSAENLVSLLGGKITGYRAIAEDAVDVVCAKLKINASCATATTALPGGRAGARSADVAGTGLSDETIAHLFELYGSRASAVIELAASDERLCAPLSPRAPEIAAQVIFAARTEQCVRLVDFLLRRTLLGFNQDQGQGAVARVAALLAKEFAWSPERTSAEIKLYQEYLDATQAFRGASANMLTQKGQDR